MGLAVADLAAWAERTADAAATKSSRVADEVRYPKTAPFTGVVTKPLLSQLMRAAAGQMS